jgi:hypothetical protein
MTTPFICLVEGHGEVQAVPLLVRTIAARVRPELALKITAQRVPRQNLVQGDDLERWIQRNARKAAGTGAILVLFDSDDDCPAELGPALLQRASAARPGFPVSVVLAHREYEAWFLAAAESLRGQRGLPDDLEPPPDPEAIRGAKEWLQDRTPQDQKYSPTADQPALTALLDLERARSRSPSFDKCYREIERLLHMLVPPLASE